MSDKETLHRLVDQLPENSWDAVELFMRFTVHARLRLDQPATSAESDEDGQAAELDAAWSRLSVPAFARDWDSEADSIYDDEQP